MSVGLRTLTLGPQPLLVLAVSPETDEDRRLLDAVADAGLTLVPTLVGAQLPRGAKLGFVIDQQQLRLRDEQDATLLRAPRQGVDADWLGAARRLRGTMTLVVRDGSVDPVAPADAVVRQLEADAVDGRLLGAIVGFVEERPTLPLLLGG